jgi:hypothetical protein
MQVVLALLFPIFNMFLRLASPTMRDELVKFMRIWRGMALATPNQWDDALSFLLCALLAVPVDDIIAPASGKNMSDEDKGKMMNDPWTVPTDGNPDFECPDLPFDDPMFEEGG